MTCRPEESVHTTSVDPLSMASIKDEDEDVIEITLSSLLLSSQLKRGGRGMRVARARAEVRSSSNDAKSIRRRLFSSMKDEGNKRVCESRTAPSSLREGIRASSPIFYRPMDESSPASPSISGAKDFVRAQLTSASSLSLPKLIVAVDGAVNRGFARMRARDDLLVEDSTIVDRVSSLLCPPKDNVRAGVTLNPSIAGLDDNVQIKARRRLGRSAHSKLVQQLSMKDESEGMSDSSPSLSSSPSSSPIRWGKRVAGARIENWSPSNDFMTNDRHYLAFPSPDGFEVMHQPACTKTIQRLLFPLTNDEGDRVCESRTASPSQQEGIAASSPVSPGSTNESSSTYPRPFVSNNDARAGVAKNLFDVDQKPPPPCPQPRGGIADDDGERIEVMRRRSGAATDLSTTTMLRMWLSPTSVNPKKVLSQINSSRELLTRSALQ